MMARLVYIFFVLYLCCILALLDICKAEYDGCRCPIPDSSERYVTPDPTTLLDLSKMVGKWYVLGAKGYKNPHPHPKCWDIEISEASGLFNGVSRFFDDTPYTWTTVNFQASCMRLFYNYNTCNVSAVVNGITQELFVSISPIQSHNYVSLRVRDYADRTHPGLKMIMSRERELYGIHIDSPENLVENLYCPEDLGVLPQCWI